jgi:hypothetical protein
MHTRATGGSRAQLHAGGLRRTIQRLHEGAHAPGGHHVLSAVDPGHAVQERQHRLVRRTGRHLAADQAVPAQGRFQGLALEVFVDEVAHRQGRHAEELQHVVATEKPQLRPHVRKREQRLQVAIADAWHGLTPERGQGLVECLQLRDVGAVGRRIRRAGAAQAGARDRRRCLVGDRATSGSVSTGISKP